MTMLELVLWPVLFLSPAKIKFAYPGVWVVASVAFAFNNLSQGPVTL